LVQLKSHPENSVVLASRAARVSGSLKATC
jgi:hypothetical protein